MGMGSSSSRRGSRANFCSRLFLDPLDATWAVLHSKDCERDDVVRDLKLQSEAGRRNPADDVERYVVFLPQQLVASLFESRVWPVPTPEQEHPAPPVRLVSDSRRRADHVTSAKEVACSAG